MINRSWGVRKDLFNPHTRPGLYRSAQVYMDKYHKSIAHRVDGELSGNLKRVLVGITQNS